MYNIAEQLINAQSSDDGVPVQITVIPEAVAEPEAVEEENP
jgi:hypothetical protein